MTTPTAVHDEAVDVQVAVARGVVNGVPRQAVREARQAANDRVRSYWPRLVLAAALAAIIASAATAYIVVTVLGSQISQAASDQAARDAAQDASAAELRGRAAAASEQGDRANQELTNRGLPPVDVPKLNEASDYDVLVASIVPVILAELSKNSQPGQTPVVNVEPQQIANAIAAYFATNPVVVNPRDIADQVAAYLVANPVPAGKDGEPGAQGDPGPAPTGEQIMAAFGPAVAANPSLLCPQGGAYQQVILVTTDGTVAAFGCFSPTDVIVTPPDNGGQTSAPPTPDDVIVPAPPADPPAEPTTNPAPTTDPGLLGP